MCKWGTSEILEITVPAHLSHTGKARLKKIGMFLKDIEFNENNSAVAYCPRCFFAGGEFTGLHPALKPIKKEWGISFAACDLCKGNTWVDGKFSNFYNSKFDQNGHLKEWAKRFLAYDEIVKVSKTRSFNKEFWDKETE